MKKKSFNKYNEFYSYYIIIKNYLCNLNTPLILRRISTSFVALTTEDVVNLFPLWIYRQQHVSSPQLSTLSKCSLKKNLRAFKYLNNSSHGRVRSFSVNYKTLISIASLKRNLNLNNYFNIVREFTFIIDCQRFTFIIEH